MPPPEKIFLVPSGYNFRAVLAFCRALEQAGHTPAIVACTADDPVFRTRFARRVVLTRAARQLQVSDFAAAANSARAASGARRCVLAPASEYLVRWALQNREALAAAGCDLPLPDETTYLRVTDKESFTTFCRARGLPVPAEHEEPSVLPCVAKPRWNVASDGRSLSPWLLRTPQDLADFYAGARREDFFFQEWVEGRSFYLLFHLPRKGSATAFSQENLAQQPGGKSVVLARSARLHILPETSRWEVALRAAGFHGVVMLELRRRGHEFVLIEANPRLWGPLQLCVDGCPGLLRRYIEEYVGAATEAETATEAEPATEAAHEVTYLWSGGFVAGAPVWHVPAPRFPFLERARNLASDVYFRPDSWRQFAHEHIPEPAVAVCASGRHPCPRESILPRPI